MSDRLDKPAQLLADARDGKNLSEQINAMDPIDRHIHMMRMVSLNDSQKDIPGLPKVSITLDAKGDPLDIRMEPATAWGKVKAGFKSEVDVFDTPAQIAAKKAPDAPKKEQSPQETREALTGLASYIEALDIPGISDGMRYARKASGR